MSTHIFDVMNKKIKSIVKVVEGKKKMEDGFWSTLPQLFIEICDFFQDTNFSYDYYKMLMRLFHFIKVLKEKNNHFVSKINESVEIIINEIMKPENDYPIWFMATILQCVLKLHSFENFLSKFFTLLVNDRCSARQKSLLNIVSVYSNVHVIQQYIAAINHTDQEFLQLFENAFANEQNEHASRIFINKFNHYIGNNIVSFFCDSIDMNHCNLIYNRWIDFSKRWHTVSFLYPRNFSPDDDYPLGNASEDGDIITIKLASIGHLKCRRDDNNLVEITFELTAPCSTQFKSSAEEFSKYRIYKFKISQNVEIFCDFIVKHFNLQEMTNLWNYDFDVDLRDRTPDNVDVIEDSDEEIIVVDTPYEAQNRSICNISVVAETVYEEMNEINSHLSSERSLCISVPETVKSIATNKNISTKNSQEGLLRVRSPAVLNSLVNLSSESNKSEFRINQIKNYNKELVTTNSDEFSPVSNSTLTQNIPKTEKPKKRSRPGRPKVNSENLSDDNFSSSKKTGRRKKKTEDSDSECTFYNLKPKKISKERRASTRIIRKPDFYDSEVENKSSNRKNKLKTDTEPPVKRIKTLLPLRRPSESLTMTQKSVSDDRNTLTDKEINQNLPKMDPFDRLKMGVPETQRSVSRKVNILSSSSQSTPLQENSEKNMNIDDWFKAQNPNLDSPVIRQNKTPEKFQSKKLVTNNLDYSLSLQNSIGLEKFEAEITNIYSSDLQEDSERIILPQVKKVENKEKLKVPRKRGRKSTKNINETNNLNLAKHLAEQKLQKELENFVIETENEIQGNGLQGKINDGKITTNVVNTLPELVNNFDDHFNQSYSIEDYIEDKVEMELKCIHNALRVSNKNRSKLVNKIINFLQDLTTRYQ